ncbi:MAG: hypothetical protein A2X12_01955 [Bacteroidetes bacterium GWE2_29_8]|nr:MAG: hypothetical protein A2X12_01955 [Bacteroidetes bacterium GWE2_29_8]
MENIDSGRIQLISIIISLSFLFYISRLIIKGKLREEYAIVWIISTFVFIFFSFWRSGLDVVSKLMGIYSPPNLVFMGAIIMILIYLLHLSIVNSKLTKQNKIIAQELALLKKKLENIEQKESHSNE